MKTLVLIMSDEKWNDHKGTVSEQIGTGIKDTIEIVKILTHIPNKL